MILIYLKSLNFGIKDFEFIRVLGTGAFGTVWSVKKKNTNDFYAMKVIDCSKDGNYLETLKAERNVFELLEGEFVVKAYYSFTYENYLFFLLEYMKGVKCIHLYQLGRFRVHP